MNRCWALFLSLCCYLRLVSAEVSCDRGGAGSFHSLPPPPPLAAPSPPCSELWTLAARGLGAGR
ncbi:Platelet-derived growth factor subunit B [Pteropus alecto]|uniref:Platelet-derived growth factor subunit B n=1 Tax=Pteropus alecto TaxID=9402 RepID=L5K919_PTEAL|nr:Platelet-derived growth factor subunit B [Pteropus alecto]